MNKKDVFRALFSLLLLAAVLALVVGFGMQVDSTQNDADVNDSIETKEPITDPVLLLSSDDDVQWKTEQYRIDTESQLDAYFYCFSVELEGNRTYKLDLSIDSDIVNEEGVYGIEKYGVRYLGEYYWSDDIDRGVTFNIEKGNDDPYDTEVTYYLTLYDVPNDKTTVNFYTHGSFDVECITDLDPSDIDLYLLTFELYCVQ